MSRKRGRVEPGEGRAPAYIYGVQPVLEALRSGIGIESIAIARAAGGRTHEIAELAKSTGIPVRESSKDDLTRWTGTEGHQGVVAQLDPVSLEADDVDVLIDDAVARGEDPLIVLLDGIQDPQNLGAILRSAYALGAHGVVIPKLRAAHVTPAVVRASAGAALMIKIVKVTNLKQAVERLVERGVWTAAAVLDGEPVHAVRLEGPLAVVIGGEATGVRPTLAEKCDYRVTIPLAREIDSLNASVAAGILLYEVARQRVTQALDSSEEVP
jgi:23S rRNA (guanosine2251-2'-O)-methyltransferase